MGSAFRQIETSEEVSEMVQNPEIHLQQLWSRRPDLKGLEGSIWKAYQVTEASYAAGKKVLTCGNGGSAADAEHVVGELLKGFLQRRPIQESVATALARVGGELGKNIALKLQQGLPAVSLVSSTAISTAVSNDIGEDMVFAQQLFGLGQAGDVLWAFSTSGNSKNVVKAAIVAKAMGIAVIAFTGEDGGELRRYADVLVNVPYRDTPSIQEAHIPVYHTLCAMLEERFFG